MLKYKNAFIALVQITVFRRREKMMFEFRKAQSEDLPFLLKMLYEAVFWRQGSDRPSFDEAFKYPEVAGALEDWGIRKGDNAVIALHGSKPIGAAWYRYWTKSNNTRGYYSDDIPVMAIGVESEYRKMGVGKEMIDRLISYAKDSSTEKVSLCVTKDNYALNLYTKT